MNNRNPDGANTESSWLGPRTTQYAIVGIVAGIFFPLLATAIKLAEMGMPFTLPNVFMVQEAEPLLWITDTAPFFLGLVAGIAGRRQDLILQANAFLVDREAELTATRASLEQSVNERTQQLDKRNAQMRAVVEFARQLADIQDLPSVLNSAADILGARFDQYEADLYLLDESGRSAVLRASSTPAGKALLKDAFSVPVGDQTAIGRVARRGKLLVTQPRPDKSGAIPSVTSSAPITQITLPLVVRSRVIGVLHLSSHELLSVGAAEAEMFQLIADQLAASIENARLATISRATVNQLESLSSQGTRGAWHEYLKSRDLAFQFTPAGVASISATAATDGAGALDIPLLLRGEKIGSFALRKRSGTSWAQPDRELVEKVAAQAALALENARLLEETSQKAAQEQVISEISARLNRSLEVDAVLQAAVREFASLPEVAEAEVRLASSDEHDSRTST